MTKTVVTLNMLDIPNAELERRILRERAEDIYGIELPEYEFRQVTGGYRGTSGEIVIKDEILDNQYPYLDYRGPDETERFDIPEHKSGRVNLHKWGKHQPYERSEDRSKVLANRAKNKANRKRHRK